MAAKIGVLGETTSTTQEETTVYTVPASKAARVSLMWYFAVPTTTVLTIKVNGVTVWTDTAADTEYSATYGTVAAPGTGVATALSTTDPLANGANIVRPLPISWYLNAADTVTLTKGTATPTTVFLQVVGVEDDA